MLNEATIPVSGVGIVEIYALLQRKVIRSDWALVAIVYTHLYDVGMSPCGRQDKQQHDSHGHGRWKQIALLNTVACVLSQSSAKKQHTSRHVC